MGRRTRPGPPAFPQCSRARNLQQLNSDPSNHNAGIGYDTSIDDHILRALVAPVVNRDHCNDQLVHHHNATHHGVQARSKQGFGLSSAARETLCADAMHQRHYSQQCRHARRHQKHEASPERSPQGAQGPHRQPCRQVPDQGRRLASLRIVGYGMFAQVHSAILSLEGRACALHCPLGGHSRIFLPEVYVGPSQGNISTQLTWN